jgi:hypothetical protein
MINVSTALNKKGRKYEITKGIDNHLFNYLPVHLFLKDTEVKKNE